MDFITSQQQPIETAGSHLIGVVVASYNMMRTAFGDPCGAFDPYKTQVEWAIQFEDGTIATIYDWKEGDCYHGEGQGKHFSKVIEWHIGGFNEKAELRVLEVITGIKDMVKAGTPLEDIPPRVLREETHKCNVCSCQFTDDEGGIQGYFGILPVSFCPTCYSSMCDMVEQLNEDLKED
jgi:hypothetical protein